MIINSNGEEDGRGCLLGLFLEGLSRFVDVSAYQFVCVICFGHET